MIASISLFVAQSLGAGATATPLSNHTERVSVSSEGTQANAESRDPSISADGRRIGFSSVATNLVAGDQNSARDIFLRDVVEERTLRVSVASDGSEANGDSHGACISGDGQVVAFSSVASNLASNDFNGGSDIFVHDLRTGTTEIVSVHAGGGQLPGSSHTPALSADGMHIAFIVQPPSACARLMVRHRATATTEFTNVSACILSGPTISGDGTYVAFGSPLDLIGGSPWDPGGAGVYLWSASAGLLRISRMFLSAGYADEPSISADGRYVAYMSNANTLVPGDQNGAEDIFVFDRIYGSTGRVSFGPNGVAANGTFCRSTAISADGRFICFASDSTSLVAGDANGPQIDVLQHDRERIPARRNVSPRGAQANAWCDGPSLSADGQVVAYWSGADNLVAGDSNGVADVFVHRFRVTAPVTPTRR